MLEPKDALKKALDYFLEAFPSDRITGVSLESLALSDDKSEWVTTLSFKKKQPTTDEVSSLELLFAEKPVKELRTIRIKSEDGAFVAIESPSIKK